MKITRDYPLFVRVSLALICIGLTGCAPDPEPEPKSSAKPFSTASEPALPPVEFAAGDRAYIRIFKQEKVLELWRVRGGGYTLYRAFSIHYFSGGLGPKLREGDNQAPEGFYAFSRAALNPNSRFHRSFNVGYPNEYDRQQGRTGSFIMVHGGTASIGCFAMTDPVIARIYSICEGCLMDGQPFIRVHIFPFRMTAEKMRACANSPWRNFWANLKEGYDFFEMYAREPNVAVRNGKYAFE